MTRRRWSLPGCVPWLGVVVLAACAFVSAYRAAFAWWVSWGPPTENPAAWSRSAARYGLLALGFLALAAGLLYLLVRRPSAPSRGSSRAAARPDG